MINIDLGNSTNAKIIEAVLGQLSDGMWENSPAMDKYWTYANIEGNTLVVNNERLESGFYNKSEDWIKGWFASKLKKVCQEEVGNNKAGWNRMNTAISDYISYHHDVTISMCYACYDFLKGRKGHKYGHKCAAVMAGVDKFRRRLFDEIQSYLEMRDFHITSSLTDLITSIVDYFGGHFDDIAEGGFNEKYLDSLKSLGKSEAYELDWPPPVSSVIILENIYKQDTPHFIQITEELGYSMSPDDCIKAEYFCKNGLRDVIYQTIEDYFNEE